MLYILLKTVLKHVRREEGKGPAGADIRMPRPGSADARCKRALFNCMCHCHHPCNVAKDVCALMQEAVKAREREVLRLGQEAGKSRNLDALAFQQRCEGQEALILQLTDQVLFLEHTASCTRANFIFTMHVLLYM